MKLYIKFRKIHKIVAFAYKNTHIYLKHEIHAQF